MTEPRASVPHPDETLIARLRADLDAAHYSVEALGALWGDDAGAALFRAQRVPARRALGARIRAAASAAAKTGSGAQTSAGAGAADSADERVAMDSPDGAATIDALAALARLFVLADPVSTADAAIAFPTLGIDGAVALGLVHRGRLAVDTVTAALDLRPYSFVDAGGVGSWWIVSDLGELALGRPLDEDHVLGVGGASLTLSGLMMQTPVDSVLDLGTGCGIQALHAARHARRVVATDISRRALAIARFNAALNDVHSIEFRLGSLYEPVAGERFDRIVSNPPFVITPRVDGVPNYEYRDGGMVGDGIVREVVTGAGAHLNPGGTAQLLGNWEYHRASDGLERLQSWIDDAGLESWVIERERQDPTSYAETWIRDGGTKPGGTEFDTLYTAWLDDFDERGVEAVGFGYVTLRKPVDDDRDAGSSPRLRRTERLDSGLGDNPAGLGDHIATCLAASDWQRSLDDRSFSRAAVIVAPDVTEERHYWPGDDDPTVMRLRQGGGFGRTIPLDTALAAVIGACDGELSIAAISAALAQIMSVDETPLLAEVLPKLRALVDDGILLPPHE